MPLPVLFIAVPAVLGSAGVGLTAKAGLDQHTAKKLNDKSNSRIENAGLRLERLREECGISFQKLGEEKLYVLNNSIKKFVDLFSQLKNVDFTNSIGLEELKKFHVDKKEFDELEEMSMFALSVGEGVVAGAAGGALAAFGAYSAAGMFATASTGTAIASLSGAAATNATLAFFGGGAISAGGLGMAGGQAVLTGLTAAPLLMVEGILFNIKGNKVLENAKDIEYQTFKAVGKMQDIEIELKRLALLSKSVQDELQQLYDVYLRLVAQAEKTVERTTEYVNFTAAEKLNFQKTCLAIKLISVLSKQDLLDKAKEGEMNKVLDKETKTTLQTVQQAAENGKLLME